MSIFRHGLDMLQISATQLKSLEIRQNILIKRSIGVFKFCKTTELNQCLKLDSINTIYLKHKIYYFRQILCNELNNNIFKYLRIFYNEKVKAHVHSFINQLEIVNKKTKMNDCIADTKNTIGIIDNLKTSKANVAANKEFNNNNV